MFEKFSMRTLTFPFISYIFLHEIVYIFSSSYNKDVIKININDEVLCKDCYKVTYLHAN